jgi:hypothetical protein
MPRQDASSQEIAQRIVALAHEIEGIRQGMDGEPMGTLPSANLPCLLVHTGEQTYKGFTLRLRQHTDTFLLDVIVAPVTHNRTAISSQELTLLRPYRERLLVYFQDNKRLALTEGDDPDQGIVFNFQLLDSGQPGYKTLTSGDKKHRYIGLRFKAQAITFHPK